MYLEKNTENKWLIKSENKILGPYNFDQISDLIRKKQISLIDEVRDAETRWLYVREKIEFKNLVEEMRKEIDSKQESTKTYQSISKSIEEVMSKTKTDINHFTDINLETQDVVIASEILTEPKFIEPEIIKKIEKVKFYGVQTDMQTQKSVSLFSKNILYSIIGVFLVGLGGFGSYVYMQKRNTQKLEEDAFLQIKKFKFLGLEQKVVDIFSKLSASNQKKILPELFELYPLLESTGLVTIEDVNSVKSDGRLTNEQRANVELVFFLQAMQKQNYGEAQEFLIKATAFAPSNILIQENDALLNLKKGQYLSAFNKFKNIFFQDKSGRYLLGMVQSFMNLTPAEKIQFHKELFGELKNYTNSFYEYKKELLLAQIVLAHESKDEVYFKDSLKQFFNTPCELSLLFAKPNLLLSDSYMWKDLSEIKNNVIKALSGDDSILFQVHDYIELRQLSLATEYVSNNTARVTNAANKEQINLLMYSAQSRSKEILALDKSAKLDNNSELNHLLIAMARLNIDANADLTIHIDYLKNKQQYFYKEWLELDQLIRKKSLPELKTFTKDKFITLQNFIPIMTAKGMVY